MSDGYISPVLVRILGDWAPLLRTLQEAKADIKDFEAQKPVVILDADGKPAVTAATETRGELSAIAATPIKFELEVDVSGIASAMAEVAALKAAVDALSGSHSLTPGLGMATGLGEAGYAGSLLAAAAAAKGGKGGGGKKGPGLLAALGWGGGAFGMAGFGSLLGMAGFGFEHVLGAGVGLAGSLGGAALGGGALGLGALTTMGVGMGTDMAGMGQAAGDIKNLTQAQNALDRAVAVYGPTSKQAAIAQAQYNYTLAGFPAVAQQAIVAAKNTAQQFHQLFNQATGPAEAIGAQIINQGMLVAEKFLPELGQAAATNMGIIQKSLEGPQGLFQWFGTQGLAIFTDIENNFTRQLPTAMDALTNGVEAVVKLLGYLSDRSGGAAASLDHFFQKLNSPAGIQRAEHDLDTMIGMFHVWYDFFKIAGKDVVLIFQDAAGLWAGQGGAVATLTQDLVNLHSWLTSAAGKDSMQHYFGASKDEIVALIQGVVTLGGTLGQLLIYVEPPLRIMVADLAKAADFLLHIPGVGPVMAWAIAFGILADKVGILSPLLKNINALMSAPSGGGSVASSGVAGEVAAVGAASETTASKWGKFSSAFMANLPIIGTLAVTAATLIISNWDSIGSVFESTTDKVNNQVATFKQAQQAASAAAQQAVIASLNTNPTVFAAAYGIASQGSLAGVHGGVDESAGLQAAVDATKATIAQLQQAQSEYQQQFAQAIFPEQSGGYDIVVGRDTQYASNYAEAVKKATQMLKDSGFGQQVQVLSQEMAASSALIPDVTKQWGQLSGQAQTVLNALAPSKTEVDTMGVTQFMQALSANGGDATKALATLQGTGDSAIQSIIQNLTKLNGVSFSNTFNGFQQLKQEILNTESPQQQLTQAGRDYADALARKVYPNIDQVSKSLQFEADQLTKGNIPALQALIGANPDMVNALMQQAGWAETLSGAWYQIAQGINAVIAAHKNAVGSGAITGAAPGQNNNAINGGTMHFAAGGFAPIGTRFLAGEVGPEYGVVTPYGVNFYANNSSTTQAAIRAGGGGGGTTLNVTVNVSVPPGTPQGIAQQVGVIVSDIIERKLRTFTRQFSAGAR